MSQNIFDYVFFVFLIFSRTILIIKPRAVYNTLNIILKYSFGVVVFVVLRCVQGFFSRINTERAHQLHQLHVPE
jgi:hypothetical protein